ncbi:MAG: hypothetical protein V4750_08905 [Pseudomonadota bacterium]
MNDQYLDKNYGGLFIVWDRLFGSYAEEDDAVACVYGTRGPLRSWNPVWANLHNYADLAKDSWRATNWAIVVGSGSATPVGARPTWRRPGRSRRSICARSSASTRR